MKNLTRTEILLLFGSLGFFIIWVMDLRAGTPAGFNYWQGIFYHYPWLMFAVLCLFYFQYTKNKRLKKEESQPKETPPAPNAKEVKKEQRKALMKGK